jgi:hypothetical protein
MLVIDDAQIGGQKHAAFALVLRNFRSIERLVEADVWKTFMPAVT